MSQEIPAGDNAAAQRQVDHQQRFALGVLGGVGTGGTALAAASLLRVRRTARAGERQTAAR
jgi:cysteine synthase